MIGNAAVAVYPDEADAGVDEMTTPRPPRATDAESISFRLQSVIGIVAACFTLMGGQFLLDRGRNDTQAKIQSDVRDILTRMEYEAKLKAMSDSAQEERFKSLEAKIESSGLRNAAMAMSTEINRQNAAKR